jgi:DNA repair protein RadC
VALDVRNYLADTIARNGSAAAILATGNSQIQFLKNLVALGGLDFVNVHPREVFRPAIVAAGSALIIAHNHPSMESSPSEADIRVTRDLVRAGQLLRIEILDHVIIGSTFTSLRSLGYFAQ